MFIIKLWDLRHLLPCSCEVQTRAPKCHCHKTATHLVKRDLWMRHGNNIKTALEGITIKIHTIRYLIVRQELSKITLKLFSFWETMLMNFSFSGAQYFGRWQSSRWRIQDFLDGRANPWGRAITYYFARILPKNCMKVKHLDRGGGDVPSVPLDPSMVLCDLLQTI